MSMCVYNCQCICGFGMFALCYERVEASAMLAEGGKATIGGFPIEERVMRNKLLRLGRALVWYLCLLWSLSS